MSVISRGHSCGYSRLRIGSIVRIKNPKWFGENCSNLESSKFGTDFVFENSGETIRIGIGFVEAFYGVDLEIEGVRLDEKPKLYRLKQIEDCFSQTLATTWFTEDMLELVTE